MLGHDLQIDEYNGASFDVHTMTTAINGILCHAVLESNSTRYRNSTQVQSLGAYLCLWAGSHR